MIKIGIAGINGRMGRQILEMLYKDSRFLVSGALARAGSEHVGKDVLTLLNKTEMLGTNISGDIIQAFSECNGIIDFSKPELTMHIAEYASNTKKFLVTGTTGLSTIQENLLKQYANHTAIMYSQNMSYGISILLNLLSQASKKLGDEFDIEILEAHHHNKVDSPSGTAMLLANQIIESKSLSRETAIITDRYNTHKKREIGKIGMSSIRGGSIIGDHSISFIGTSEMISLSHRAFDRSIFVDGAIRAAYWLASKKPGLYNMQDVSASDL